MTELPQFAIECPMCGKLSAMITRVETKEIHAKYCYKDHFEWHHAGTDIESKRGRGRWQCSICGAEIDRDKCLVKLYRLADGHLTTNKQIESGTIWDWPGNPT